MTPEEMRAVGLRIYHDVIRDRRLEVIDEVVAEDCLDISPIELPGVGRDGREPLRQFVKMIHDAFPDLKVTVHQLLVDGDTGVGCVTMSGTHQGDFMGIPATGKQVSFDVVDIVQFREGLIRQHYGLPDIATLMMELGVIPAPGGSTA